MQQVESKTPKELGYRFPAEWERHSSTWLSYPHNNESWPGKIDTIFPFYHQFIKEISKGEIVNINVADEEMKNRVGLALENENINMDQIRLLIHPTNDAWCRDHGPAFLINPEAVNKKIIVNWKYNAWGNKYRYNLDTVIPSIIAREMRIPVFYPGIVMEGGSVDFNGMGTLLTTTACLLHENRNPGLSQSTIEQYLTNFYGVEQILWLDEGIDGDDTNGHIDDITRFVNSDTIVTVIENNKKDINFEPLQKNLRLLKKMRLLNGKQMNIIELPMPDKMIYEGQRLPASYANFYISNNAVIVPTYHCKQDEKALEILSQCFKERKVIGIDSVEIIWGLGSWHCLSQQEPFI